jgi:hypothetical protein
MTSVGTAFSDVHDTRCVGRAYLRLISYKAAHRRPLSCVSSVPDDLRRSSPTLPCACYRPAGKTPARACSPSPPPPCFSASGALAAAPARRTIGLAVLCGLAAFLVDVYLY